MFKKLSLKYKILLIIFPLAIALLVCSSVIINDYRHQGMQMSGLALVTDSFDDFGKLVEALQIERGKSGLFLNNKITLDELNAIRKEKTDPQIAECKKMMEELKFTDVVHKELLLEFNKINMIRTKVDSRSEKAAEIIALYSDFIHDLFVAEGQMATFFNGKKIEMDLVNITLVEGLKETIAIVRAKYTAIFSADIPLTPQVLAEANYAVADIRSIANSPGLELVPELNKKAKQVLTSEEWSNVYKDINIVVEKATKGNFGVDPKVFFDRVTKVIDQFGGIIANERVAILKHADDEAAKARNTLYFILVGLIIVIGGLIAFSWMIMRDLVLKEAADLVASTAAVRSASMVDNSPTSTMMCDPQGTLIYMNESTMQNLRKLQQYIPEKVDNLIGKSIDIFHKNPAVQRKIISDPKNLPHRAVIALGPEKLDLLITASIDPSGKYLGAAVAWSIVTAKVELIKDLTKSADDLASAAANVLDISSNLSAAAEETSAQANTASVASEEVNAGVQTVASNMEEMVAAIKEITKTTNEAASMTNEAMRLAKNTNTIINQLGDSSNDIGNVIKVISSIAQQTNLLALNATIEAARAGEAGKGFAVVANEVKELAKQTAIATSEITKKIETIQGDSRNAVDAIAEITIAIEKVNGYTGNIAASVEEQAATTNEVTRIVTESAEGVKQINENVAQVSTAAASTGKDAGNAQSAARGVGDIAELLKKYVARLKIEN